jgi:hypothetical protein
MSVSNSSSRDPATNAGSDSAGHCRKGSPMEQFAQSKLPKTVPSQNDPHVLDKPKTPTNNGIIRDKA